MSLFFDFLFNKDEKYLLAKKRLLDGHSFSLPSSAKEDRLIQLKQFYRISKLFMKPIQSNQYKNKEGDSLIYTINENNINDEISFIESNSNDIIHSHIIKEQNLQGLATGNKFFLFILLAFLNFIIFPFSFFSTKNRLNLALLPEHFLGIIIFLRYVNKNRLKKTYIYYTHEPEVPLLCYYLLKQNIHVSAIPNANPLFMFNKVLIANRIILSLSYQKDEMNVFSNLPFEKWSLKKLSQYYNYDITPISEEKPKLFYYSHASWIRIREQHNIPSFNEIEMEFKALQTLKNTLKLSNFQVVICLHPKEMKESLEKRTEYYNEFFGTNFSFFNGSSYKTFEKGSLGVGAFSSILFERIECGYKTFFIMDELKGDFPIPNSGYKFFVKKPSEITLETFEKAIKLTTFDYFKGKEYYTYIQ